METFALQYASFGEKVIAAEMVSMLNDKCFAGNRRRATRAFSVRVPLERFDTVPLARALAPAGTTASGWL